MHSEEAAKLLTSIAALVSAVAWPAALFAVVVIFRNELRATLRMAPIVLDRIRKASLAGVAVELEKVSDAAVGEATKSGKITPLQIDAANRIAVQTKDVSTQTLAGEMDRLCLEYDSIRRTMDSGVQRTKAMTSVLARMRALAPSIVDYLAAYKSSGSAGSRLAAVAIMQMAPRTADLDWLGSRFTDDQPFIFYHAALALQNFAHVAANESNQRRIKAIAETAKAKVEAFRGVPDGATIEVLDNLIETLQV